MSAAGNSNLDQLEPSFMYTQVLKEILLTIDFKEEHLRAFAKYSRDRSDGNAIELTNIDKFEHEYQQHTPIWWYTYQNFLSSMIDSALRNMDAGKIIDLGFFIRDLHEQIVRLDSEQSHDKSFVVYYGQGLTETDFDRIRTKQGGLLAFNQFLLTNKMRQVPLDSARKTSTNPDTTGVLFVMAIDPSVHSVPFANIHNVSYHQNEDEVLFSMHSIFRIGEVKTIEGNKRLWQVDLTLTNDNDEDLQFLTEQIREETMPGEPGWQRLSSLLIKMGCFDKAEQIDEKTLSGATDEQTKANIYDQTGYIKESTGEYTEAITFYEKSLAIKEKILPPMHIDLANSYMKIASAYQAMAESPKALEYYEKALEIQQQSLPAGHPDLASNYDGIGNVYSTMGEDSKALSYYERSLQLRLKSLPPNHPDLGTAYSNIGGVYENLGEYSKALVSYEKALQIQEQALPPMHPVLATSYNNLGKVYENIGDHSKALAAYERAGDIAENTLPENHPELLLYKNSIEAIKKKL